MSNVKAIKDTINVRVVNNTAFTQSVNLLGGTSDPLGIPPHLLYQWDLSGETYFGTVTVDIVISSTANPTPIIYTVPVDGYNIQAVAFALNTLNLGNFQVNGNIIYVSNDFYIYGALTVLSTAFVSTWDTTNTTGSSSASNQIKLPLDSLGTYDFIVFWGDGTQDTVTSWNQAETLHTYATAGIYTIGIVGTIVEWSFGNSIVTDSEKLLSISSWGALQFGISSDLNFFNCLNLDLSGVTDVPDLSATTSLQNTFDTCSSLTTINKSNEWNTSNIINMIATFGNCNSFNSDISNWDVSNCTDMNAMFFNCLSFNSDISGWDVSQNTDMYQMFRGCQSFNQPIGSWNTSNVTSMQETFFNALSFNQPLNSWDVSGVTNMILMFNGAIAFNQPLNSWNTSSVLDMSTMFGGATFFNSNITSWNVASVTNMQNMFAGATAFNQAIGIWNVGSVTNMSEMFFSATGFNQDLGSWDVSSVNNFSDFMQGKTNTDYLATYLDSIYNTWSTLAVQPNLANVNFGTIKYTVAGQAGKNILTSAPNNWLISDGGI
jgi:surface protein